jgi:glycerol-3-phosphate dehydrogenase subunit B
MGYGVKTDAQLHAVKEGVTLKNVYAIGSILGKTRPELGSGAGLAINSAFAVVDQILRCTQNDNEEPASPVILSEAKNL